VIYHSDALSFLSNIESYSIDLIYSDVPFGTGNKFKDYDDSIDIDFTPILLECKRVLKPTGLIYIHCDYNISHSMKLNMDEIFGKDNFRNEIIWHYNSAPRKKKDFGKRHDTIFRYSLSDNYFFNVDSKYIRQPYSSTAPRGYAKEKYYNEAGKVLDDVWNIPMLGQNDKTERVGYSTQKPLALLYPIIDSSCPNDGIVLDMFMGSGTTLVASKILKRRFIGCDINDKALDICRDRLNRV